MSIYKIAVTQAGAALLTQAAAGGGTLTFTRAQLGSGITTEENSGRTELVTPVCYTSVEIPSLEGNIIKIPILFTNRLGSGGFMQAFTINELGLWARLASGDETLLAYANAGADADGIAVPGDALTEFTYLCKIQFSEASNVVMNASALEFVTRETLDTEVGKVRAALESEVARLEGEIAAKADRPQTYTATLTAAGWAGSKAPYTQTVSIAGVPAEGVVIVGLAANASEQQIEVCRSARIEPTQQAAGAITVAAQGVKPGVDLPISATVVK